MKKITLEEHFSVPQMSYRLKRQFASEYAKEFDARLLDIEQWRLPEMDQHDVAVQALSFTCPGIQGIPDAATAISAEALGGVRAGGGAGRAHLAAPHRYALRPDEDLWGYNELFGSTWNWGVETTHALRLVFGRVFDAFPSLTVILGHLGEMLPYALQRLDDRWKVCTHTRGLKKEFPSLYIKDNMLLTTSGNFSDAALLCALLTLGADRILVSIDYPYQRIADGAQFIEAAPISDADKAKSATKMPSRCSTCELVRASRDSWCCKEERT